MQSCEKGNILFVIDPGEMLQEQREELTSLEGNQVLFISSLPVSLPIGCKCAFIISNQEKKNK